MFSDQPVVCALLRPGDIFFVWLPSIFFVVGALDGSSVEFQVISGTLIALQIGILRVLRNRNQSPPWFIRVELAPAIVFLGAALLLAEPTRDVVAAGLLVVVLLHALSKDGGFVKLEEEGILIKQPRGERFLRYGQLLGVQMEDGLWTKLPRSVGGSGGRKTIRVRSKARPGLPLSRDLTLDPEPDRADGLMLELNKRIHSGERMS